MHKNIREFRFQKKFRAFWPAPHCRCRRRPSHFQQLAQPGGAAHQQQQQAAAQQSGQSVQSRLFAALCTLFSCVRRSGLADWADRPLRCCCAHCARRRQAASRTAHGDCATLVEWQCHRCCPPLRHAPLSSPLDQYSEGTVTVAPPQRAPPLRRRGRVPSVSQWRCSAARVSLSPPPPHCSSQRRASISSRLRRRCSHNPLFRVGPDALFFLWPSSSVGRARTAKDRTRLIIGDRHRSERPSHSTLFHVPNSIQSAAVTAAPSTRVPLPFHPSLPRRPAVLRSSSASSRGSSSHRRARRPRRVTS